MDTEFQPKTNELPSAYIPLVEQMAENLRNGDDTLRRMLRRVDFEWEPVDIRTFIENPEYFGKYTANLDEKWKQELEKVFAPNSSIVMFILTGSTSSGKTTCAMICLGYILYRLACLKDPASFYNLLPGSRIVLAIFSITLTKAETGHDILKLWIDESPWFKKYCPRRKRPDDPMLFPSKNLVVMIGSGALHALGENLFACSIDEANFYHQGAAMVVGEEEKTKARQLFTQARERIYGRFVTHGGACPGLAILMSSCRTEAHFLELLMEEISGNANLLATTHIVRFARWDIKKGNRSIYSGKTFPVLIGDDHMNSRILEEDEIPPEGYEVLQVPVEHSQSFEFDVEDALRDVGGVSVSGNLGFFSNRGQIYNCVDRTRESPFLVEEITTCYPGSGNKMSDYLDIRRLCKVDRSAWVPLKYPGAQRFCHVDLAATQEGAGVAVGCPVPYPDGTLGVYYDLIVRLQGCPERPVDFSAILDFLLWLGSVGIRLSKVTYDTWNSLHSIQVLSTRKQVAGIQSVNLEAYTVLKSLIHTGKCSYPNYGPALKEMVQIRKSTKEKDRPHHAPGGTDDLCDAMAGVAMLVGGLDKTKKSEVGTTVATSMPVILTSSRDVGM